MPTVRQDGHQVTAIRFLTATQTAGRILTGVRTASKIGLPYALRTYEEGDLRFKVVSLEVSDDKCTTVIGEIRQKGLRVSFSLRPGVPAAEAPIIVKLETMFQLP